MTLFTKLGLLFSLGFLLSKPSSPPATLTTDQIKLSPLKTQLTSPIRQLDITEQGQVVVITQDGELWQLGQDRPLASELSPDIALTAKEGRVAAADSKGNFLLWTPDKTYRSAIPLSPQAGMTALKLATIAISPQDGDNRLVRIGIKNGRAVIEATGSDPVLPDTSPIQVNLTGQDPEQGHIAVLAKPDSQTYQHGVLGDAIEAREIQYLERHSLQALAEPLSLKGLVFEANRLEIITHPTKPNRLVSVLSGQGAGARTALISLNQGKLQLDAQSPALPTNRWQSPFVFQNQIYAVQMPHLKRLLVRYQEDHDLLTTHPLAEGLSNHTIHSPVTNLAASTDQFALIPQADYRSLALLDGSGQVQFLPDQLPAPILRTVSHQNTVYLLLEDGQIWQASLSH